MDMYHIMVSLLKLNQRKDQTFFPAKPFAALQMWRSYWRDALRPDTPRGLRLFVDDTSADLPKPQSYFERIDFGLLPPRNFVADLMILPVMCSA
jgi:hypothetical protein